MTGRATRAGGGSFRRSTSSAFALPTRTLPLTLPLTLTLTLTLTLAAALSLTACGSDGDDTGLAVAASTVTASTVTASTVGTATSSSTGTSTSTGGTANGGGAGADPPVLLPEESNCAPGPGDLPDGIWFGYRSEALDDVLAFDLACWFSGEPAVAAAADDGAESPPPNDYYIRNASGALRYLPVASPGVPVVWLPGEGAVTGEIAYNQWVSERASGYVPPLWVVVEGGEVVRIVEQYLP